LILWQGILDLSYQIDVRTVAVVENGRYLHKLGEDLIVTGHVRGQNAPDDALANVAEKYKKYTHK